MNFQFCYNLVFTLLCTRRAFSLRFKDGGAVKFLNEIHQITVTRGETAELKWVFQTKESIPFHGIVWTIYDRMFKNYTKFIWMDEYEKLYRHLHTKNRREYEVRFKSETINNKVVQLTILIPDVQQIHENGYVCHIVGSKIGPSEIKLKVEERIVPQITSSNDNRTTVLENTEKSFTCSIGDHLRVAWFKNNINLTSFRENRVSFTKIFSKDDEGEYECVVNNNSGNEVTKRLINIIVNERLRNNTFTQSRGIEGQQIGTTVLSSGGPKSSLLRHSDMKLAEIPIITLSCSAGLVIAVILGILIYKRRRTYLIRRDASCSVESIDMQNPIMSTVNCHENRRVSLETNTSRSDESIRTGFSYEDSIGDQSQTTFSFEGTSPEQFTIIEKKTDLIINNKALTSYEIDRSLLQNMVKIGEGSFGIVAKATLLKEKNSTEKQTVAVKMLKAFASPEDKQDLISELNIMSRIEGHRNVVKLIGCATLSGPVFVITEYVSQGDLLGFLRKSRGLADTVYEVPHHFPQSHLSQCQLLKMARDVAMGMAHLSRNQVIHRDLAARNVLVGENLLCKITDFGMARDVKSTNYYRKRSRGRIPMKWTAIEALVDERYTCKSDVWSFGILLYEIVTMGGTPYPGVGARELLRKLRSGWRMSKPAHVDMSLYRIMLKCWSSNPDDRPLFSGLVKTFKDFISASSDYINVSEYDESKYQTIEGNSSTHSYSDVDE